MALPRFDLDDPGHPRGLDLPPQYGRRVAGDDDGSLGCEASEEPRIDVIEVLVRDHNRRRIQGDTWQDVHVVRKREP